MTVAKDHHHIVNCLLQRLNQLCRLVIIASKGIHCDTEDFIDCPADKLQLPPGHIGKSGFLRPNTFRKLHKIGSIVADTLKVGNRLHQHVQLTILLLRLHRLAQANQEAVGRIGKLIQAILIRINIRQKRISVLNEHTAAPLKVGLGDLSHGRHGFGRLGNSHRRRNIELFIQSMQFRMTLQLGLVVANQGHGHFHQHIGKGNQGHSSQEIERCLEIGDDTAVHASGPVGRTEYGIMLHNAHDDHKQHRTNGVEQDMHHSGTLGILGGADGADHGSGHTGAQVDAHNHRISHSEGYTSTWDGCNRLQHTHCGRGTLDNHSQSQAHKNAQQRVLKDAQERSKGIRSNQGLHTTGHEIQANEQNAEADENISNGFGGFGFHEHQQNDTDHQSHRSQRIGVKQHQQPIVSRLNGRQANNLCRNRGANVGAHDNGNSLLQS